MSSVGRLGRYVPRLLLSVAMAASAVVALPAGQAAVPPGTYAYVANNNSDNVSVINTATNTVTATVPVGDDPQQVAVAPDGTRVPWPSNLHGARGTGRTRHRQAGQAHLLHRHLRRRQRLPGFHRHRLPLLPPRQRQSVVRTAHSRPRHHRHCRRRADEPPRLTRRPPAAATAHGPALDPGQGHQLCTGRPPGQRWLTVPRARPGTRSG